MRASSIPAGRLTGVGFAGLMQPAILLGVLGGNMSGPEETVSQLLSWSSGLCHLSAPASSVFPDPSVWGVSYCPIWDWAPHSHLFPTHGSAGEFSPKKETSLMSCQGCTYL